MTAVITLSPASTHWRIQAAVVKAGGQIQYVEDQGPQYIFRKGTISAGAIGNELLKNLALLGVGHIDIFDFDTIEIHNLTRSVLFQEDDVGQPKARVAAPRIQSLNPHITVRAFIGDVREQLALELLRQYRVVIACLDNMEGRFAVNRLCYQKLTSSTPRSTAVLPAWSIFPSPAGTEWPVWSAVYPRRSTSSSPIAIHAAG